MTKTENEAARRADGSWDPLKDSGTDRRKAQAVPKTPQTLSPSYRLAYADEDFLCSEELRPVRLQLELLKVELSLKEMGIKTSVVSNADPRIREDPTPPLYLISLESTRSN